LNEKSIAKNKERKRERERERERGRKHTEKRPPMLCGACWTPMR
jgi:TPP-dependent indolepyruvate ferredoxin oxidoreductase alpha subunit